MDLDKVLNMGRSGVPSSHSGYTFLAYILGKQWYRFVSFRAIIFKHLGELVSTRLLLCEVPVFPL